MKDLTKEDLHQFHSAMRDAGVPYAMIGGTACFVHGTLKRTTVNIDLIIRDNDFTAFEQFTKTDTRFDVQVGKFGQDVLLFNGLEVEAFNVALWPERPYGELIERATTLVLDPAEDPPTAISVICLADLTKDKLATLKGRQHNKKSSTDMEDVKVLLSACYDAGVVVDLRGEGENDEDARGGFEVLRARDTDFKVLATVLEE